jgi:hypothetical protein
LNYQRRNDELGFLAFKWEISIYSIEFCEPMANFGSSLYKRQIHKITLQMPGSRFTEAFNQQKMN